MKHQVPSSLPRAESGLMMGSVGTCSEAPGEGQGHSSLPLDTPCQLWPSLLQLTGNLAASRLQPGDLEGMNHAVRCTSPVLSHLPFPISSSPWKSKSVREGLMASRSVPRSPSGSRGSCMVLAGEGSASSLVLWLGGVWAGRGESWGVPGWARSSRCPSGCGNNGCGGPGGARPGDRCEYVCP